MGTLTLYQYPRVLYLTLPVPDGRLMNYPINRSYFKLFQSVTNEVQVYIRDQDRHAVDLTTKAISINIIDERARELVLQKDCTLIDAARGLVQFRTTPDETSALDLGFYSYNVMIDDALSGTRVLAYTDLNYGPKSFLEVVEGPMPAPSSATEIPYSAFVGISQGVPPQSYFVSAAYPGAAAVGHPAVHGVAVYTTNYSGQFWIQASLENGASLAENDWFDVAPPRRFVNQSGITYITFEANVMRVRFRALADTTVAPNGTLDKVLFKN